MKYFKFKTGTEIPALGFGTWQLEGEKVAEPLSIALEVGFRHIDTAWIYANQNEIGKVLQDSKIPRQELFVTSKVWTTQLRKQDAVNSCKETLEQLRLSYLDLFLIHWPNKDIPIRETLEALEQLKEEKLIRDFGVSNFNIARLTEALKYSSEIVDNQVEFHPSLNQKELKSFCDKNNILMTAYSPIAQGQDLKLPGVSKLADKYKRTPSQIIINWLISKNIIAIPRSGDREHIADNFHSLDFQLSEEDTQIIDNIGGENRLVNPKFFITE
ncbi:aldo/keto reductase [Patescibacteria group bacterium]|nr:aldo/keto reductase [Patescibacteria group bacterium]